MTRRSSSTPVFSVRPLMRKLISSSLMIGVVLTSIYLGLGQIKIKQISCQQLQQPCPLEIKQLFQPLISQPLFFTDLDQQIKQRIQDQPLTVANWHKKIPDQLLIELAPLEPGYNLQQGEKLMLIDVNAHVQLPNSDPILTIQLEPNCTLLDQNQHPDLPIHAQILMMKQLLAQNHVVTDQINCLDANTWLIQGPNQPQFLLHPQHLADQTQKLIALQKAVNWDTWQPRIVEVDLRFNQPVLREQITITPTRNSLDRSQ